MRIDAFGWPGSQVEFSQSGFESLKLFDFNLYNDSLVKLSALHPEDSARSAVGQRLIQYLIVAGVRLRQLQSITPLAVTRWPEQTTYISLSEEDQKFLTSSDEKFDEFKSFLYSLYAKRLGIDPLSLILDQEVSQFRDDHQQMRIKAAMEKYRQLQEKNESIVESDNTATSV